MKLVWSFFGVAVIAVGLAALGSCSASDIADDTPDRSSVFEQLGDGVIAPNLEGFATRAGELTVAAEAFCGAVEQPQLDALQDAWKATRRPWSRSEAASFGPVRELGVENAIDFWPARSENIESALTTHSNFSAATIDSLGASAKGLPAIEYLLFGDVFDDAVVLAAFADADAGAHRCSYLVALSQNLEQRASALHAAWVETGGHLEAFKRAGEGREPYPAEQDAVDILVNTIVAHLTEVVDLKLDKPLQTTGDPVELLVSRFCDCALNDLRDNLAGVAALYYGEYEVTEARKPGLHTLVAFVDPALDERVRQQLAAAHTAAMMIDRPLRLALTEQPQEVMSLRTSIDELRRLFKVEVVSALSVTLSLSDNDGD